MTDTTSTPIVVPLSALRPIATAMLRQALTLAGTSLVAKGYLAPDDANALAGPMAEQVIGAVMVMGSAGWAWWRARHVHAKLVTVAGAAPNSVAVVTG